MNPKEAVDQFEKMVNGGELCIIEIDGASYLINGQGEGIRIAGYGKPIFESYLESMIAEEQISVVTGTSSYITVPMSASIAAAARQVIFNAREALRLTDKTAFQMAYREVTRSIPPVEAEAPGKAYRVDPSEMFRKD
jgi:hypothetical protein